MTGRHKWAAVSENTEFMSLIKKSGAPSMGSLARACILFILAALLAGCQAFSRQHAGSEPASEVKKTNLTAQAQIVEDEAMLKGSQAVIGGTVRNISDTKLERLGLEIELRRRSDGSAEARQVSLTPDTLAPGEEGRYALSVSSREWGNARILRLRSGAHDADIVYQSVPGAKRPLERIPDRLPKVVVVPRSKPKGEEFINTPDNPEKIR